MKLQQVVYDYVIESTHAHAIIGYAVSISSLCVLAILCHNNFLIFARVCPNHVLRIRDILNSRVGVRASLQLDQSGARELSDIAKSRMRTREFVLIKCMRIRDIVNRRVRVS